MRYGIISDIHSNLEALRAALEQIGEVDAYICPGDFVGYGADPNECCDIVRGLAPISVVGNHDAAVVGSFGLAWFNPIARAAAEWTASVLSEPNLAYLGRLKPTADIDSGIITHGSLDDPLDFRYIADSWTAAPTFDLMAETPVCFIGHTHIAEVYIAQPGVRGVDQIALTSGGRIEIKEGFRYMINCGSVGQPRDGEPTAACGLYDTGERTVKVMRAPYDVRTAQKKIRAAGLPQALADRLSVGF